MSVQVRRRREAASFLSTYVGAQGELLVDTTNNRVQVHDGATPGGWPAAALGDLAGRNAIINGSFAINQRGYASGATLAAGAYAHDRWKAGASGGAYAFAQAVPDTTITIGSGTLLQAVEAPNVYATAWWLTWAGSAQARVWQGSASGAFSAGTAMTIGGVAVNALQVTGLAVGAIVAVEFQGGSIGRAQLEVALPNAGPTRFERRQIGHELSLCQRYYEVATGSLRGSADSAGSIGAAVSYKVSKRAAATVVYVSDGVIGASNSNKYQGVISADDKSVGLQFIGLSAGQSYYNYGFTVTASAEI